MKDTLDTIQQNNVRLILDNHIGSANQIAQKEWYELTFLTLETLKESLLSSFGKFASNTLIIHENISSSSVFTQDGIHIVSSFEFASLIQTYIARYVQYVGERVEKSARDGTTTAMILFIEILYEIYKDFYKTFFDSKVDIPIQNINVILNEYVISIKKALSEIMKFLEKQKFSIDEVSKYYLLSKEKILYNLSYITSKGNVELSEAMVEIFKDMPYELYDYFIYYRSDIETDNPFEIYKLDYDYELTILVRSGREHFNVELNTVYEKKVDLVILPEVIFDSDIKIIQKIEEGIESLGTNIVIIWNTINDKLIYAWEKRFKDKNIISLQYINYVQNLKDSGIELNGFLKGSDKTFDKYFIEDVDVRIEQNKIKLNGVITFGENGFINKRYYDQNSEFYVFIQEVKSYIKKLKNNHTKSNVELELKESIKIYRNLIAPKYPILRIGGRTLDHLAMIDVVEDTVGALTIALEKGCLVDGLLQLKSFLSKQVRLETSDIENRIYEILHKKISKLYKLSNFKKDDDEVFIIQNYMIFKETFDRLFEVLPKLILTTEVLVPGTVSVNKNGDLKHG